MKAVILTGGKGIRFGGNQNKCSVKLMGVPLIDYTLALCKDHYDNGNITQTIVVVGDRRDDIVKLHPSDYEGMPIVYVDQMGDSAVTAIMSVFDHVKDNFMLFLGDEVYDEYKHSSLFEAMYNTGSDGVIGCVVGSIEQVKKTYTFCQEWGLVKAIVEKPGDPFNEYVGTGNCILPRAFFKWAIDGIMHSGMRDFPSVIDYGILKFKAKISYARVAANYFNINTKEDYEEARAFLQRTG